MVGGRWSVVSASGMFVFLRLSRVRRMNNVSVRASLTIEGEVTLLYCDTSFNYGILSSPRDS